ncbi:hypothetical protein KCP70_16120 [Salmonella enterica subsp. enterica]|nr:hypothetical protein KCP70_16120 [Salmonella enterica subsp. enterica]
MAVFEVRPICGNSATVVRRQWRFPQAECPSLRAAPDVRFQFSQFRFW